MRPFAPHATLRLREPDGVLLGSGVLLGTHFFCCRRAASSFGLVRRYRSRQCVWANLAEPRQGSAPLPDMGVCSAPNVAWIGR